MKKTADMISELLRPGGRFIIFCTVEQFVDWYEILFFHKYVDPDEKRRRSFSVDNTPMEFFHSRTNPMKYPARQTARLFSVTDFAWHGVRNGNSYAEQKDMAKYRKYNYVPSTYPGQYNIIDQMPNLGTGESLCRYTREEGETMF
eukprot:gb/GEZJ01001507.1/.p3 GENE.gb/GEZJ01001507.1/~~gb/GEZJ01001507.1/.p3  ORF type:complete len:145 (+),score=8.30 gb/GEZJ01001507.1/:4199-4633(+)